MRKSLTLKTLLRSPMKTLLTFMLIAAASFALFSRVTDYAVTSREITNAKNCYHGVAALDNTVPPLATEYSVVGVDDKPWPADEKMEEFASLPGVTLADERYMTAGLMKYKRLPIDKEYVSYTAGEFAVEGTYEGYEDNSSSGTYINILLGDVEVLAGDIKYDPQEMLKIETVSPEGVESEEELYSYPASQPRSFFDGIEKGSRCLIIGEYDELNGLSLATPDWTRDFLYVLDGYGEDYLDTEEFADLRSRVETYRTDLYTYDIAYTSDMRSIPYYNERKMVVEKGRPLMMSDTDGCVVSEFFLEKNNLSVGDKVSIKLGDRLGHQNSWYGMKAMAPKNLPNFVSEVDLEIVGAYRFTNDFAARDSENAWTYTQSTVFVPVSLLPVQVPDNYTHVAGELSVWIEDAHDIEAFREAAEPLAAELGMGFRFSDGGWMGVKDSFEIGMMTSILNVVLYVAGAVLALFLAVYLYIGRNRKAYAIMRTLGVPVGTAERSLALPLAVVAVIAVSIGGLAGILYTSETVAASLEAMAADMPDNYVPDAALPIGQMILCLCLELMFILFVSLLSLRRMKKIPPLELLQAEILRVGTGAKATQDMAGQTANPTGRTVNPIGQTVNPAGLDMAKLSAVDAAELSCGRRYGAVRHAVAFTFRYMRRGIGKTALTLIMTAVLAAGIGAFILARVAYGDAFYETDVKGKATGFSSASVAKLSDSELVEDVYYYSKYTVHMDGVEEENPITFSNDFDRYLENDADITYAQGYDGSIFEGTGPVCLMGRALAEEKGVSLGDEITLLTDELYVFMGKLYEDEELLQEAALQAGKSFKVVGILESEDEDVGNGIFAAANDAAETFYGQPFPIGYCEFTLADNRKLGELNALLDGQKEEGIKYAPTASYYIDFEGLKNIERICSLLESLFPIAVAAAVFIGMAGYLLVILQSAKEAAFLRILGVTKKRARCMLTLEQVLLCVLGIVLVAGGLALHSPGLFARSTETLGICYALYFLGCLSGAAAAAVHVTRGRILELLQVKE